MFGPSRPLVLGKTAEAAAYADLLEQIKAAFCREFLSPNGRLGPNTQTSYVLALMFELLPPEQRDGAAARLAADVRQRGNHMTTGFLGASFLPHVLSSHGYLGVAYDLLEQEAYPGWLYPVTKGATTIWERWDGLKPDGTFQDVGMNSFNHYAYGAIGEWLYRVVAGLEIDPDAPGYKRIVFHPRPGGQLEYASASHDSLYGRIESGWARDEGVLQVAVTVPPNTEGVVYLPAKSAAEITEGGLALNEAEGVEEVWQEQGDVLVRVGSGQYNFSIEAA